MTKKNQITRLFSALLALVMLLSVFPGQAFATEQGESLTEDISAATESEALPEEKNPTKSGADYLARLDSLSPLVPVNELVDLTEYKFTSKSEHDRIEGLNGLFYFVTQVTEGNKTVYYMMDPSCPTIYEKVAATPVEIVDNRIVGADPEMAMELIHDTGAKDDNQWEHRIKLRGDYDDLEEDYYLVPGVYSGTNVPRLRRITDESDYGLALRQGPGDSKRASLYFYRSLSTTGENSTSVDKGHLIRFTSDADGNKYFELALLPNTYGEGNLFKVYRLLTDRVNVENLLDMLNSVREDLPFNDRYTQETYDEFLSAVQDAIDLYTAYNGRVFSAAESATKEAVQTQVDSLIGELMSLRSQLRISKNIGNQGSEIRYKNATVYRWNEDKMNELIMELEDADTKGFFFTSGKFKEGFNRPNFSKWNGSLEEEVLPGGVSSVVQRWGIHSGLTKKDLDGSLDPMDPNVTVSADLWDKESVEGLKSAYTDVKLPFVYDVETRYYEMNSDKNAVFFGGEPASGAELVIVDRPGAYSLNSSGFELCEDPDTYVYSSPATHKVYDRYVAGFQPFSPATPFEWKSFRSDADYTGGIGSLTPAYLLDGISWDSSTTPTPNANDFGRATWGFGMMVEFTFRMTEGGTLIYTDTNGASHEVPITFEFSGDDDVWVYIDDKLAMDIGGTHDAIQGRIDFQTGNVTLRSDKYGRITDLHDVYTQNREGTNYAYSDGGSIVGEMYEENIYTGKVGPETAKSASDGRYATLADGKDHVIRIYYMDRGKGKTNCTIRFNLPQTDVLTVEKKIDPYYSGNSSEGALSDALRDNLTKKVYTFILRENGKAVANMPYYLTQNGAQVGSGVTNGDGQFTLRGDQIAEFRSMNFTDSKAYSIEEVGLSPTYWGKESYTYIFSNYETSVSGTGNSYAAPGDTGSIETLSFVCTNVYVHTLNLEPEPQAVVLDYGKPIEVEVVRNAVITGASEIWVRQATLASLSFANSSDKSYGTTTLLDKDGNGKMDSFRFTLQKMLDKVVTINAYIQITFENGDVHTVELPVHMIPATQVYYETDFAPGAFTLKAEWTDKSWQFLGTPQNELQDSGAVEDKLKDLTIYRESIPSNAFFADFDGKGMEERYRKHLLYNGMDFDAVDSTGVAINWAENNPNMKPATMDHETGLLTLTMANPDKTPYIQTGPALTYDFPLTYHPEEQQYLQVRFKLENFVSSANNTKPQVRFFFYTGIRKNVDADGNAYYDSNGDQKDMYVEAGRQSFGEEYLENGEFLTVTIPLNDNFSSATQVTAFRMNIVYIKSVSATELGSMILDYLYVGPMTDLDKNVGQDYEVKAPGLLFDFNNDASANLRYQGTQYNKSGTTRNYDQKDSWIPHCGTKNGAEDPNNYSIDTTDGVYNIPVGNAYNTVDNIKRYGPYFYMTDDTGKYISYSEGFREQWRLNYTIPHGKIYFHVRFKVTGATFNSYDSGDDAPYVQCTFAGYDAKGNPQAQHPRMVYDKSVISSGTSGTFYDGVLDITNYIRNVGLVNIQNLYVRFLHLHQSGTSQGKIQVDYIYVGPEGDPDKVRQMQEGNRVMIDFNNTERDKQRYSDAMYSGMNHDAEDTWDTEWFTWEIKKGRAFLTPTSQQEDKDDGYASFYTANANLNYKITGQDYIQIRFRIDGAKAKDEFGQGAVSVYFGPGDTPNVDEKHMSVKFDPEEVIDQGWFTFTYNLASHVQGYDTLNFVFPVFYWMESVDPANPAKYTIDYIYMGPLKEGRPVSDSLFFGFENEEIDRNRYDSATYSYHNYDAYATDNGVGSWKTDPAVSNGTNSYTLDNEAGILTLGVTDKLSSENIRGPYLATSDLYNLMENRSENKFTLNFVPEKAEYMQIRFRTNKCQKSDNAPRDMNVVFLYDGYDKDGNYVDFNTYNNKNFIRGYYEIEDGFQTLTIPLSEAIRDMRVISNFGIRFQHMSSVSDGSVDIDYIYVGPGELVPDPVYGNDSSYENVGYPDDVLFFGFGNEEGDRRRYESEIYGGLNHDLVDHVKKIGYWGTNGNLHEGGNYAAYNIDTDRGVLSLEVTNQSIQSSGTQGPFLITAPGYKNYYLGERNATLHYPANSAEIFRIRFRLVNCEKGKEAPKLRLLVNGFAPDGKTYIQCDLPHPITMTNEYQVIDVYPGTAFQDMEYVSNLGLRFRDVISNNGGYIEIDYIYIGPEELAPPKEMNGKVAEFSNGSTYFVEGSGVKLDESTKTYTEASFTFTGTGFDLISRTGKEQATIRVEVQDSTGSIVKTITVNNKGDMELSQIPVVSVHGLSHGVYQVFIWVNKAVDSPLPFLSRGGQFYFDAVRIYDPMDVSMEAGRLTTQQMLALDAYREDKEAHDYVKEIRDILLSVADFNAVTFGNSTAGALFVDSKNLTVPVKPEGTAPDPSEPTPTETVDMVVDHIALQVKDYNKVGPKNEIYLSPGEAVVFKLVLSAAQKPVSIDIGAKTVLTDEGVLAAGFVSAPDTAPDTLNTLSYIEKSLATSTAMYYELDANTLPESGDVYLVIYNAHTGTDKTKNILSITDLKVAYKEWPTEALPEDDNTDTGDTEIKPEGTRSSALSKRSTGAMTEPYSFTVDNRTLEAAAVFMNGVIEGHKAETPILDQDTGLYHSLNLASDIAINYLVPKAALVDYDRFYLVAEIPTYDRDGDAHYRTQTIQAVDKEGDYYYFTLDGLTAVNMNDTIHAVLRMEKDGIEYYTPTDEYSISSYAYAQLNSKVAPDKLKALCAELLRYGAAAQSYKGYRTDTLADDALTDVHRSYLRNLDEVTFGNNNTIGTELTAPSITWFGKALDLNSRVSVLYCVNLTNYTGNPADLTMKVTYTDTSGQEATVVLSDPTPYAGIANCYSFLMDSLLAAELRTVLTAQVYVGDTPVSNSLTYSADTYGVNKTGALGTLCKALFAYSDSAKVYFS